MKMVFALTGNGRAQSVINSEVPPNVLCSQIYLRGLEKLTYSPTYLLLDSGAFSSWNKGRPVALADYLPVARRVQETWPRAWIINLDVIPGEAGRTATQTEIEMGMKQSLANADVLRAQSLRCVEVFHQNEPFSFLEEILDRRPHKTSLVGLSPRNDLSVQKRCEWLQSVLGHLVRKHGVKGLPRFHGLAATGHQMLETFPFYSADSSTWVNGYRYGLTVGENGRNAKIVKSGALPGTRCESGLDLLARRGIRNLLRLGDDMTRLWEKRGVVWED